MTDPAFEATLLGFRKIRQESENRQPQVGNFKRVAGVVMPTAGACGKGGRRANTKSVKDLIRYLERKGQRFNPIEVDNALRALRAVKGQKDIDLTTLAQYFGGLVDVAVLASNFVGVRTQIREKSNDIYTGASGLIDGSAHRASFDSSSTANAKEQAMKDDAIVRGKRFRQACLPGPEQKHPKDAKSMLRWLSGELGVSDLTRSIGVKGLDGMVEAQEAKLMEQKVALERLLDQASSRDQDPAFHEEVRQLGDEYMASQAIHIRTLAFVANVLGVRRHPIDLPPDFRLPTLGFAQSLLNLAHALQAPGSDFMQDNRWAYKVKAEAERRLREPNAPKAPVVAQDANGQSIDHLRADAVKAYSDFEAACLRPGDGAVALNEGQTRLRHVITQNLSTTTATERLPLGAVKANLFGHLPDRIRQLYANLGADVAALQRSGATNPLQLKRVHDVARELNEQIDGYLAQLDAVSRILLADPQVGALAEALDTKRLAAGHSIQRLCLLEQDPNGELMRIRAFARQNKSKAEGELTQLGMTPASKVRGMRPRPLDSEPAHMQEAEFDKAVDEMLAPLMMTPREPSFQTQIPEARQLPTQPIRAPRQVSAKGASSVETMPAKSGFRADWDLGHAHLDSDKLVDPRNPRWSVALEDTLSGIDAVVKKFDQAEEIRPSVTSVQRPRGLNRQNASANLANRRAAGPAKVSVPPPPDESSFDEGFDDFLFDMKAAVYDEQFLAPAGEIARRDRELRAMRATGKRLNEN